MFKYLFSLLILLLMGLIISSCGQVTVQVEVLSPPEATALANDLATQAASVQIQSQQPLLPAPIIYLDVEDNQLWQLSNDGETTTLISKRGAAVTSFDVSSVYGDIVYVANNNIYHIHEGNNEAVLIVDGVDLDSISGEERLNHDVGNVKWSSDGQQIIYRLGIVDVNTTVITTFDPIQPLSWSPDGPYALIMHLSGETAILNVANGTSEIIEDVLGCQFSWSLDSQYLFCTQDYDPFRGLQGGLWQIDIETGQKEIIIPSYEGEIPSENNDVPITLFHSAQQLNDGNLYGFVATGTYNELFNRDPLDTSPIPFRLSRIWLDDMYIEVLNTAVYDMVPNSVLWAKDGSGAVITTFTQDQPFIRLVWLPIDGSEPVNLGGQGYYAQWSSQP